jgi:hypothetical protein
MQVRSEPTRVEHLPVRRWERKKNSDQVDDDAGDDADEDLDKML